MVVGTAIASSDSDYGNLAVGGASVLAQAGLAKYGRDAELESDYYGMQYMSKAGYDPQGAVKLQETFVRLSEGRRSDWLSGLFASHPPSQARVDANIATAAALPPGGKMGEDEFQSAMQKTRAAKPAYDAYDEGRKALAEDKVDEALSLANKALDLYPEEAHFHALRGDIRLVADKYDMAVTNYNRAISRRDGFFYYHLQRGLARMSSAGPTPRVRSREKHRIAADGARAFHAGQHCRGARRCHRGDRTLQGCRQVRAANTARRRAPLS